MFVRRLAAAFAVLATVAVSTSARANPRPLPFTYTYETLGEGESEIEQYVDLTPVKALSAANGATAWYGATQFQTEFEYGITKRLEIGLYATYVPSASSSFTNVPLMTEANGMKQRLRLRLAEEGQWPVDVALYGEIVENDREIEIEAKIILQKRFGDLRAVANLWAEREYYYQNQRDWVLNPTLGLTYQVSPMFHPGVEGWLRTEFPDPAPSPRPFNVGPHLYAGPTMMFNFGRLWWSTGAYLRTTDFGRSLAAGDAFGSVWFRTIIGIGL